ncbi:Opsin Rh3, partial [Gryllus bimaculatus]
IPGASHSCQHSRAEPGSERLLPSVGHGCQLYGFVGGLTGTVSIVTLALIAYDRFNVIVFPMEPSRKTSHASARAMVLCAWLYGATFSSLPLTGIGVSPYTPEGYLTSCSFDYMSRSYVNRVYIFTFFSAAWVLPLCVITFCYSRIYYMVIRTSDVAGAVDSQRHCREEEKKRSELKLAGVVAGVVVLWFVSWTPYAVVALLGVTGRHDLITPLSSMVPALFCKTASCIDPFVYAVTHPRFRKELRSLWRARRKKKPERGQGKARRRKTPWTVREEMRSHDRDRDETSDSSEPDVEEVFVMVDRGCDGRESRGSNSSSSGGGGGGSSEDSRPERSRRGGRRRRSQRISWTVDEPFPFSQNIVHQLQPPSWFVPPQPHSKRSASLRLKEQENVYSAIAKILMLWSLSVAYNPNEWRLFIDLFKFSLKDVSSYLKIAERFKFRLHTSPKELAAWKSFISVVKGFLEITWTTVSY